MKVVLALLAYFFVGIAVLCAFAFYARKRYGDNMDDADDDVWVGMLIAWPIVLIMLVGLVVIHGLKIVTKAIVEAIMEITQKDGES